MRIAAVALAVVLGSSLTAAAQPGLTPPQTPDIEQPVSHFTQPPPPPGYIDYAPLPPPVARPVKSEGTATMLSLGTTAAGFALIAAAGNQGERGGGEMATIGLLSLIIGPSAGHIYAGETSHAVGMSLLRGGAFVAFVVGVIKATTVTSADCVEVCSSRDSGDNGATLMWVGGLTFVAATVYDIIDAPRAARRRNAKERQFMMQPIYVGTATGPAPGIGFAGKF